jgi:hypothetical protein
MTKGCFQDYLERQRESSPFDQPDDPRSLGTRFLQE